MPSVVDSERIEDVAGAIVVLRGHRVLLDTELAVLYGVTTKRLNEQVKRNRDRFPDDFLFRLTVEETEAVNRSQIATGSRKHRDPRFPPYAFTEHGSIMAATVVNSPRAVEMRELFGKLNELERKLHSHDQAIVGIIHAIRELMGTPRRKRRPIGFTADLSKVE